MSTIFKQSGTSIIVKINVQKLEVTIRTAEKRSNIRVFGRQP